MRIVITGGTGTIGRWATKRFLDAGHSVIVLSRSATPPPNLLDPRTQVVKWTTSDGNWQEAVSNSDAVIGLAGKNIFEERWNDAVKVELLRSRVEGTRALVRAMKNAPRRPRIFLSASAIGFYGPRGDEALAENEPGGADFLASLCQEWEAAAQEAESLGVRGVRLRIGVVLSPDGGALAKMLPPFRWFVGGPLGSGQQWFSWIHRFDMIRILEFCLQNDSLRGAVNCTAPAPLRLKEFCHSLGDVMGRPSFFRVPGFALRLRFGEVANVLLTGQRVVPQALQAAGFSFTFPTAPEALKDLLVSS